ncbi:MAG: hypothetical protein P4L51_11995 [Puia sp.]|nr:hypothetical protein [Puia sp.]
MEIIVLVESLALPDQFPHGEVLVDDFPGDHVEHAAGVPSSLSILMNRAKYTATKRYTNPNEVP